MTCSLELVTSFLELQGVKDAEVGGASSSTRCLGELREQDPDSYIPTAGS